MSDWAYEKAKEMFRPNYPKIATVAQALREARAEGMREAAKVALSWTPNAKAFANNETRNNSAIAAAIILASGEGSAE